MPSGKSSKAVRNARSVVTATKPRPWGTVAAVLAVLVFAAGIFGYLYVRYEERRAFTPTETNQDPSTQIEGVVKVEDLAAGHIAPSQRVAYDHFPPFGGPHDPPPGWAACNGQVYDKPVRNEAMVHSLEHGAVWIAYHPDQVSGEALDALRDRVEGQAYIMLSPYPGLDSPISLQSWGHQLKLDDAEDKRIDQFIQSLRLNEYTYPEPGASCDASPGVFNPADPPPFVAEPPGPDAIPMDYTGRAEEVAPPAAPAPNVPIPPPGGEQPAPALPPAGG